MYEGKWVSDPIQVKEIFRNHFSNFFAEKNPNVIFDSSPLICKKLTSSMQNLLERDFSKEELCQAVNSINPNKSPGPDGFNAAYLKEFWNLFSEDIGNMAAAFHLSGFLPPGINSSFLTLIPKLDNPILVIDYRPISLINCTLKIFLKLLAHRLSCCLNHIISEEQFGFVKGRNISENVLIVKEIVHSLGRRETDGLVLKIDFEKAFDSVKWSFLFQVLNNFGFGKKWSMWLDSILKSARMSILINDSPTREFKMGRGLRQGDLLSPILFNIISEVLHLLLQRASEVCLISGIKIGKGLILSHILFADDTIIFMDKSWKFCVGVKLVLIPFEVLSGLRINFSKSSLFASKGALHLQSQFASSIGCKIGEWPMRYLGHDIAPTSRRNRLWWPLVKKVKTKLSCWKERSLNKTGRMILLKAVINNISLYWMSNSIIPVGIVNEIDLIRRNFFWGSGKAREENYTQFVGVIYASLNGRAVLQYNPFQLETLL